MESRIPKMNRRTLMAIASAATAGGALAKSSLAQEAQGTPNPEDTGVDPEGGGTPVPGTPVAGIEAGDVVPPEIANAADTDWLVENRNLAQDRSAPGSSIASDTVDGLTEAWTYAVPGSGAFGTLTANPIILGDTLYLQDVNSNVYALNRESGEEQWVNQYDLAIPSGGPNGMAIGYGAIAYAIGNSQVVLADQMTGEEFWTVDIEGPRGDSFTTAPLIYDNQI